MDLVAYLYGALACITTERARIAAQDPASASVTVMRSHPALYRAVTSAQHHALTMRREACLYGGDLVPVPLSDSATPDTHEALSDDADIRDAIAQEQREAHELDAALSTRDDGAIYHGRLPHEDDDPFTPWVILPPPSHTADHIRRHDLRTLATSRREATCAACGAIRVTRLASYLRRDEFALCGCPVEGITDATGRVVAMEPDLTPLTQTTQPTQP